MVSQLAHLPAMLRVGELIPVGLADLNQSLATQVARRYGFIRIFPDHDTLLKDPEIDAVVVVTHRAVTDSIVRAALEHGKHVLSEKPMAFTVIKARELVDLAKRKNLIYGVGFMKRYDPGVVRAKELLTGLLRSGRLGHLISVRVKNFCAEYVGHCDDYIRSASPLPTVSRSVFPAAPDWLDPEFTQKYDWFANVGLHSINLLRYLLDNDLTVRHADFAYNQAATVMLGAAGVPITIDIGKAATGRWEESLEFFFERGRLKLQLTSLKQRDRCAAVTLDENVVEAKTSRWGHDTLEPWSFTRQMRAFSAAIAGQPEALLATGEDSIRDMELMEEIFQMAQGTRHG